MIFKKAKPLSPETQRLLALERDVPPESQALRLRSLARARIASAGSRATVRRTAPWSQWRFVRVAGLSLALASASLAAWRELQAPTPVVYASPVGAALAKRFQTIARLVPTVQGRPPNEMTRSLTTAEGPGPAQLGLPQIPSKSQQESRELGLLQTARVALNRGGYASALSVLAEHRRRFPSTSLDQEREALRIKALEGLGQTDEARRAGERFRERYPRSVLSPQLGEAGRGQ